MALTSERENPIRLFCRTHFEIGAHDGSTLILDQKGDPEGQIKHEHSLESFAARYVENNIEEESLAIYKLFGGYI